MATSAPPPPTGADDSPNPGLSGMMGSPPPTATASPSALERKKDTIRQVISQIQDIVSAAKTVSQQFPEFGEFAKTIEQACKDGQTKVVGNALQSLEGPPPPTAAV